MDSFVKMAPMFLRNILLPSSGPKRLTKVKTEQTVLHRREPGDALDTRADCQEHVEGARRLDEHGHNSYFPVPSDVIFSSHTPHSTWSALLDSRLVFRRRYSDACFISSPFTKQGFEKPRDQHNFSRAVSFRCFCTRGEPIQPVETPIILDVCPICTRRTHTPD